MKRINLQLFAKKDLSKLNALTSLNGDLSYDTSRKDEYTALPNHSGTAQVTLLSDDSKQSGSISGVDQSVVDRTQSSFQSSNGVKNAMSDAQSYLEKVQSMAGITDVIGQSTWDTLNSTFQAPSAVTEAFNYTNGLLQQLSSGRTSYTDQIQALMSEIQNRDKFSYDVDTDTLFQQALASAMSSGKTAMQDTIGQASALTGGYGSTYATSAGNQAYNSFIQDAYANLPEYYQMALEAYQMEGEEMYQQLSMLNAADATEYQRMYDSWSANFSNAQQMYQNAYGEWHDSVNNAYNSASLQLQEHSQLFDQAYSAYQATSTNAQQMYQNEYAAWADEVAQAQYLASMMNSDYWNGAELAQRQTEHEDDMAYRQSALAQDNEQFYASLNQSQSQFAASQAQEQAQFVSRYDLNGDGIVDAQDTAIENTTSSKSKMPTYKQEALKLAKTEGDDAVDAYVDSLGLSEEERAEIGEYLYGNPNDEDTSNDEGYAELPLEQRTFTKVNDTMNGFLGVKNLWGGIDGNDVVQDQYGNEYKISELPENMRKQLSDLKKGESYSFK